MEHNLDKEKMDSIRAIANASLEVSKAKIALSKLKEEEADYLIKREKLAADRIAEVVGESRALLEEIKENHEKVMEFYGSVKECSDFLAEAQDKFHNMVEEFNEKSVEVEKSINAKEEEVSFFKKMVDSQKEGVARDLEFVKRKEKQIKDTLVLIESRQAQIKEALKALKKQNGRKN